MLPSLKSDRFSKVAVRASNQRRSNPALVGALPAAACNTQMINDWLTGDRVSNGELFAGLYVELSRIAHRVLAKGWRCDPLETTELVSELYLRLRREHLHSVNNRAHFLAICALLIHQIMIERVRRCLAEKTGGKFQHMTLNDSMEIRDVSLDGLRRINEAVGELRRRDPWLFQLACLRLYLGMTNQEIAEALGVHPSKIKRDWRFASTWLRSELEQS